MRKTKPILVLTERFYPEEFLVNDLIAEWIKRGDEIEVLTQTPSYPFDRIYDGYENRALQTTTEFHGIKIHRVKTVLGYNVSKRRKVWNYICFAARTSWWVLWRGHRYSRVFTHHSGPLTMATAGALAHYLWRLPSTIWTQDLWPDAVYNYGVRPTWWVRTALWCLIRFIYGGYQRITVTCPGFIPRIREFTGKTAEFVPQWSMVGGAENEDDAKSGRDSTIFLFAGNLGSVQNLLRLVEAFGRCGERLVLAGGGIMLEPLKKLVAENGWKNVEFLGRRPQSEMAGLFARADVLVISLESSFALTIPSKFQAYLASGKPILAALRGDTARLVSEHDVGMAADPDEIESIQNAVREMSAATGERLRSWGANARQLSDTMFDRQTLIEKLRG